MNLFFLFLALVGSFGAGLGVGWHAGHSDGKQLMRDCHGIPKAKEKA
jgi:hypothetical protein